MTVAGSVSSQGWISISTSLPQNLCVPSLSSNSNIVPSWEYYLTLWIQKLFLKILYPFFKGGGKNSLKYLMTNQEICNFKYLFKLGPQSKLSDIGQGIICLWPSGSLFFKMGITSDLKKQKTNKQKKTTSQLFLLVNKRVDTRVLCISNTILIQEPSLFSVNTHQKKVKHYSFFNCTCTNNTLFYCSCYFCS